MSQFQFHIGDRVRILQTGIPTSGTIIALFKATHFSMYFPLYKENVKWDELFPAWRMGIVADVEYDRPQKHISFEEYFHGMPAGVNYESAEALYDATVKTVQCVHVPVCDLEQEEE